MDINIESEWAPLKKAITYDGDHNALSMSQDEWEEAVSSEELAKHPEYGEVYAETTIQQLRNLHVVLQQHGVELVTPIPQDDAFCQLFCRDPAFVINDTLFLANMRDEYRHAEVEGIAGIREQLSNVVDLREQNGIIEGGDIMVMDKAKALIGTGQISDHQGALALAEALKDVTLIKVPHTALHLDCCFAPLPDGKTALYSAEHLPHESRSLLTRELGINEWKPLDYAEDRFHLSSNILWIDENTVVSTPDVPRINALLTERGYEVIEIDVSQLVHLWGSVRCAVAPLMRG